MTESTQSVLGSAVFGTSRGLAAAGNGVLAEADKSTDVFEFRGRTGPPRRLLDECLNDTAIFCRRAEDAASRGRKIVIVGALKACPDSQSRPGFYGACVAVPLDTRQRFSDWMSCLEEIRWLFKELEGQVNGESGQLRFAGGEIVRPTQREEFIKWRAEQGEMLLLHNEGTGLTFNKKILQRLQAVAYVQGHTYPTAVAVQTAVPEAQSLCADFVEDAMRKWSAARDKSSREEDVERDPDVGEFRGHECTRPVNEPDDVRYRIGELEHAVESLQMSVVKLSRNPMNQPRRRAWQDWLWAGVFLAVGMSVAAVAIALATMN